MAHSVQLTNGNITLFDWVQLLQTALPSQPEKRHFYDIEVEQGVLQYQALTQSEYESNRHGYLKCQKFSLYAFIAQNERFLPIVREIYARQDIIDNAYTNVLTAIKNAEDITLLLHNVELKFCNVPIQCLLKMREHILEKYSTEFCGKLRKCICKIQEFVVKRCGALIQFFTSCTLLWIGGTCIYSFQIAQEFREIRNVFVTAIMHRLENELKSHLGNDISDSFLKKWISDNHPDRFSGNVDEIERATAATQKVTELWNSIREVRKYLNSVDDTLTLPQGSAPPIFEVQQDDDIHSQEETAPAISQRSQEDVITLSIEEPD